jgi:hypothetical protein
MRRVLAGLGAGAVLGLGVLAAPAQAAEPARASVPVAAVQAAGNMVFYDDFWTRAECEKVGSDGVARGMWRLHDCQESFWDWDLYVGY